ncbi:MAG TPA: glycogen-binding domain-containing protein, partial [Gemmatimonadales bacterium]
TTVGLRWLVFAPRVNSPARPAAAAFGGFRVERGGPMVRLLMPAPHAAGVELMGDFTDWEPVAMLPDSPGWWTLSRTLAPGIYRVNVRVDGGPWRVPPGIPAEDDDLGGKAGVLLVP